MIILDTETTGLDHEKHEIVSLGAMHRDNHTKKITSSFYAEYRVKNEYKYEEIKKALKVNGFSMTEIYDEGKVTFSEGYADFKEWCLESEGLFNPEKIKICGQNIHFDSGFIKAALDGRWDFDVRLINTYGMYWVYQESHPKAPESFALDAWIKYFKLDKRSGVHNALTDVELTVSVINKIAGGTDSESLF